MNLNLQQTTDSGSDVISHQAAVMCRCPGLSDTIVVVLVIGAIDSDGKSDHRWNRLDRKKPALAPPGFEPD